MHSATAPYRDPFRAAIVRSLQEALGDIAKETGITLTTGESDLLGYLAVPPQFELGQAALPCFPFAKQLRGAPPKIAADLKERLEKIRPKEVARIDVAGGYLNFHVDFSAYGSALVPQLASGSAFRQPLLAPEAVEKIVVEFSQPNTHKALHVGHLRCVVLGDAVCNVLEHAGHTVVRATYPGDMGAHIAKTLWYITRRYLPEGGALPSDPAQRADWLGEIYAHAHEAIKVDTGTPREAENRAAIAAILHELKTEAGPDYALWKETREWSFDAMRAVYAWLSIRFDVWFTESECDKPSAALVKQKLVEGFFKEDDGAVGIDLSEWKLGFAMYLKRDGNGLYITKDLELLRRKFEDSEVTRSIYVVDARQKLHFQQLFKTAELMGFPHAAKSVHLPYETVNDESGAAFSSRELNGLKLSTLRDGMEAKVTADYLERYRGQWSDEDIVRTAEIVTVGALKYGMLKVDNNTPIRFVQSEWLRLDGETGPYLQYVHARCHAILEKQGSTDASSPANPSSPTDSTLAFVAEELQEKELLFALGRFNDFALKAAQELRPSIVAGALFDLAKGFNRFYEHCSIRDATGDLRASRLALVAATAQTMKAGLALLGIPAPDRM